MYFEKDIEKKKVPAWAVEGGIPAYVLPEYTPIGIPVQKTKIGRAHV